MIGHGDARSINISLSDGKRFDISRLSFPLDEEKAKKNAEKYELRPDEIWSKDGDQEATLNSLFRTARKMTEKGWHACHVSRVAARE